MFRAIPGRCILRGAVEPVLDGGDARRAGAALRAAPSCFARRRDMGRDLRLDARAPQHLLPFGVNMAFRLEVLKQFRFREDLGRRPGGVVLSGEETQIMTAMLRAGHTGVFMAGNPVVHRIARERQTLDYIGAYYRGQGWQRGVALAAGAGPAAHAARHLSVAAGWLFSGLAALAPPSSLPGLHIWLHRQAAHFNGRRDALRDAALSGEARRRPGS